MGNNIETDAFTVSESEAKKRLDKVLAGKYLFLSRNQIQKLIKQKYIKVEEKTAKSHTLLQKGQKVKIFLPQAVKIEAKGEKIPLDIVYEDKNLLLINKPAGMVIHPAGEAHQKGTVVNAIIHHCKDLSAIGGKNRHGIVHRLDKDTSGLLVVAKNDFTHQYLAKLFKNHEIKKTYLALVKGQLSQKRGIIEAPIFRSNIDRKKMAVSSHRKAKKAITEFKVITNYERASLLEIRPLTGRTHQIRVHLRAIHHPVIGDEAYGDEKLNTVFEGYGLQRMFLHAYKLKFKLPSKQKESQFIAQLPLELKSCLDNLSTSLRRN